MEAISQTNKIVLAGGTGFLGQLLQPHFIKKGCQVVVLGRKKKNISEGVHFIKWDGFSMGEWRSSLEGARMIINLVGKSVNCRYTEENKCEIIQSRVQSTRILGQAINACNNPPEVWVNAASAAIYGDRQSEVITEESEFGGGFSPLVCKLWERAFYQSKTPFTRKVVLRIGMVLSSKSGGVLQPFVDLVRVGLGGKMATGKQYLSWAHELDFLRAIDWINDHESISGAYILSSPEPTQNTVFMRALRKVLNVRFGLSHPIWQMKLGAIFMGTESELVIAGRRVVPQRLMETGFEFSFPNIEHAFSDLFNKK